MPVFIYSAQSKEGRRAEGDITAKDLATARQELQRKNLTILSLVERKKKPSSFGLFGPPKPRVKTADIAIMTRQLSTMISSGIPILEAFEILEEQATDKGFKLALGKIIEKIRSGTDFSTALSEYPKQFSKIYINMVKSGEASGQLDVILTRLAEYMESAEKLKREIKSAMTYPVVAFCMIIAITIGLLVFIVPQFKKIFEQLGGAEKLPLPTKVLMGLSDFTQDNIFYIAIAATVLFTAFIFYKKTPKGEKQWHWFLFHIPIFGSLFRKVAISRFSRTFSTLLSSGVPMITALEIVAGTSGNRLIEDAVLKTKDRVMKGETLGEPLTATKIFPPMVTRMIAIGEKTGALEKLLSKISEFYDQQVKATVEALTSLIEPLLIGVMGTIVGGIVLAIFLPILSVQEMLSKR